MEQSTYLVSLILVTCIFIVDLLSVVKWRAFNPPGRPTIALKRRKTPVLPGHAPLLRATVPTWVYGLRLRVSMPRVGTGLGLSPGLVSAPAEP